MKYLVLVFTFSLILNSCDQGDKNIYDYSVLDSAKNSINSIDEENVQQPKMEIPKPLPEEVANVEENLGVQENPTEEILDDPSGTYIYERGGSMGGKIVLRITGNTWISKLTMNTGFGESYDDEQAMYSSGYVDGRSLLDETGYVKVGRLWRNANKRWAVDFAGSSGEVTMFKQ
jgi:hypothetical protein